MTTIINPAMAIFLGELAVEVERLIEKHSEGIANYGFVGVRVYTDDGYTASFVEEGINLYPEEA